MDEDDAETLGYRELVLSAESLATLQALIRISPFGVESQPDRTFRVTLAADERAAARSLLDRWIAAVEESGRHGLYQQRSPLPGFLVLREALA
jgi:hypothetical protein